MRSLETLDLLECGETVFLTALERKETRALHKRSDFPFTNPLLQDKFLTIRKEGGKVEWHGGKRNRLFRQDQQDRQDQEKRLLINRLIIVLRPSFRPKRSGEPESSSFSGCRIQSGMTILL